MPQRTLGKPAVDGEANELPVVALPKRGRIVRSSESLEALMKRQRGRRPIDCDMGGDLGVAAGFTWYCEAARCVDDSCSVRGLGQLAALPISTPRYDRGSVRWPCAETMLRSGME